MKRVHVTGALITTGIVFVVLTVSVNYARRLEQIYIHALIPLRPEILITGIALHKAAFSQPDLLPVYGASEELLQANDFQATQFFRTYPTGFAPADMSQYGSSFIISAQTMAGVGSDLQGRKVVFSFTPDQFSGDTELLTGFNGDLAQFSSQMMDPRPYGKLFSRLDANELVFSSQLSYETKQLAARRMLQYPETLESDPILKFALEQLADDTFHSRVLYYLSYPLGKLQALLLELQDHYWTLTYIQSLGTMSPVVVHHQTAIDWNAQRVMARLAQLPHSNNNRYGFDNAVWKRLRRKIMGGQVPLTDASFAKAINDSVGWKDLELLLRITIELGGHPLLLGRPVNARYYHAIGVSDQALQVYYTRLDNLAKQYGVPVIDFRDRQNGTYFDFDPVCHTSREGWVYVDQALDTFYHQPVRQADN